MIQSVRNAFSLPDLRRRILFTFGILVIYRLLANISVPGVNIATLQAIQNQASGNALIDVLDLLSGGAVRNLSVMAMGVYPYITASIIIQLLTPIIPYLSELDTEGESGRNKKNKLTYYLSIPMAVLQGIAQINLLGSQYGSVSVLMPNFGFTSVENIIPTLTTLVAMTAGTLVAIWLGELITEQGIGQGVSLIIFAGIVSRIPYNFARILALKDTNLVTMWAAIVVFIILTLVTVVVVVYIQEGQRRIPVQYGRRVRGRKVYQGQNTFIPLRVNTAGMIPIIFASSLLAFPALLAQLLIRPDSEAWYSRFGAWISGTFGTQTGFAYWFIYFIMVVGFTFFYTDVMIQQQKLHESLQRQGGFIPGIRPGFRTAEYIKKVVRRITFVGAFFLGIIAVVPGIMQLVVKILPSLAGIEASALVVNGSSFIIMVGVVIDTMRQLESQLLMRNYEGFL